MKVFSLISNKTKVCCVGKHLAVSDKMTATSRGDVLFLMLGSVPFSRLMAAVSKGRSLWLCFRSLEQDKGVPFLKIFYGRGKKKVGPHSQDEYYKFGAKDKIWAKRSVARVIQLFSYFDIYILLMTFLSFISFYIYNSQDDNW